MPKTLLTDKAVQAAKAEKGKRLELWDTRSPGLCLRVSDVGGKTWFFRYRTADGRQPRLKLGDYSQEFGLADARKKADRTRIEVQDGADPASENRRRKAEAKAEPLRTIADLAETYFSACETGEWRPRGKRKRESTLAEEKGLWRRHLEKPWNGLLLDDVTAAVVRKRLRAILQTGKGTTSNRVRSLVSQMLNFAVAEGRLPSNPASRVKPLSEERRRVRVLSDAELRTLWRALEHGGPFKLPDSDTKVYVGPAVRNALKLLLLTLTRRSEVAELPRSELDLGQSSWTIRGSRTKNGRAHFVPLSAQAVDVIEAAITLADEGHEKPSPVVFPHHRRRAEPLTADAISHALRALCPALGLDPVTPHDLRRTAATIMAGERLRVPPHLIGRLLNHSGERGGAAAVTIEHYALHDYAPEKRAALAAWATLLKEIVTQQDQPSNIRALRPTA